VPLLARLPTRAPRGPPSTTMTARSLWYVGGDACELRDCSVPVVGPGEVLVVATHGAVSRGTESLVLRGGVPPSEHTRMRCPFMEGDFNYPCKYGYCSVGFVAEAGKGAEPLLGRHVFCLFPHQDRYVVRMEAVHALPEGTPPSRAVLTPNLETAVNIVWDSKLSVGDRLAVVGAGVVGCLVAYVASRVADVSVLLVDVDASRSALAERLGVRFRLAEQLTAEDADRDVVVHCSGGPAGCATALSLAGDEAAVVEASWFGDKQVSLPLGEAFHSRRLKLVSSQVGQLPVERRPRWTYARRIQVALRLAADPLLDVLIAPADIAFEDLPKALPEVCSAGAALCRRILYPVPELPPTPPRPNDLGQPRLARMKIALNTQA